MDHLDGRLAWLSTNVLKFSDEEAKILMDRYGYVSKDADKS